MMHIHIRRIDQSVPNEHADTYASSTTSIEGFERLFTTNDNLSELSKFKAFADNNLNDGICFCWVRKNRSKHGDNADYQH